MATLRQYFETDFPYHLNFRVKFSFDNRVFDSSMLYDFIGFNTLFACYIPNTGYCADDFIRLVESFDSETPMHIEGTIVLPQGRSLRGNLKAMNHKDSFEVLYRDYGAEEWTSTRQLTVFHRVYIYSEADLSEVDVYQIRAAGERAGLDVRVRSVKYERAKSDMEKPLAFISHDSRDKDAVARPIATTLETMGCPVWYDEFSLQVGNNLRDSIEKGLKECRKCILVLSSNFLSNNGWGKKEFDSIFTREIIEEQGLVLPIWYNVSKRDVFDYSPSLLNVLGLDWNNLGAEEVCRRLRNAIDPPVAPNFIHDSRSPEDAVKNPVPSLIPHSTP